MMMRLGVIAGVSASALFLFSFHANAQITIHPIVLEGYTVTGVGNVPSGTAVIENFAVNNNGLWLVETDTDNADTNADEVIVTGTAFSAPPLTVVLREADPVTAPAGATLDFFDSTTLNNAGNRSHNHFLANTGATTNDSGIYFNNTLLIQESNISTASGFSANTPYIGWFETHMNNSNQIMMVSSVDDPAIASTVDRALVRVSGTGPLTETVYAKEGDLYFGFAAADFGTGPHDSAFNDLAQMLYSVDTADPTTTTDGAVVRDDGVTRTILAREGSPSAVGGRNWGTLIGVSLDMNNSGDWVMRGDLDGATADDLLIVKNGTTVIAREASGLPAIGAFTFTAFGTGAVQISDAGDVFWLGDWNDPDLTKDVGIFMNDTLLIQEGVTLIDGVLLQSISLVESNFRISDNGQWLVFEGVLANGLDGAFLVQIPEPSSLGLIVLAAAALARRRARA